MEENKGLLLKCAMSYGLAMGIFWVVKYLFLIFAYSVPFLILIYMILTLAVPFVAYVFTKRYRQDIGGTISFFHAWRFGILLYFFAALIVAVEHFIFFQFIAPPDFLANTMSQLIESMKNSYMNEKIIDTVSRINLTPIHMAIQGIFNNIFYGIILSIPVAAIVCHNNPVGVNAGRRQEDKQ